MSDFKDRNEISESFQYDGVSLPRPDKYWVTYEEVTRDMERLLDTGEMIGYKIGDAKTIHWLYRYINADTYEKLVNTCVANGGDSPFHVIKTLDQREKAFTLEVYRSSAFNQEPDDNDDITFKDENAEDLYAESNIIRTRTYTNVKLEFICKKVK